MTLLATYERATAAEATLSMVVNRLEAMLDPERGTDDPFDYLHELLKDVQAAMGTTT